MILVEPVLDHAAAERARLVTAARARLLGAGGAVTIEVLDEATGRRLATAWQWVRRQRESRRLVTVTHDCNVLVPTFQLDDGFRPRCPGGRGRGRPGRLRDVRLGGVGLVHHAEHWLDGAAPAASLATGDLAAVHGAAHRTVPRRVSRPSAGGCGLATCPVPSPVPDLLDGLSSTTLAAGTVLHRGMTAAHPSRWRPCQGALR